MSKEIEATAQHPAPTSDETTRVAPAPGTNLQDTDLTGSGEVTRKIEVATREKPEEIQSPEEWLKNASALNEKIISEAKTDGVTPPATTEEATPTEQKPTPVETVAPTEETEEETEVEVPGEAKKSPQHRIRANDSFDDQVARRYRNAQSDGKPISWEKAVQAEKAAQAALNPESAAHAKETPSQAATAPRTDGKPATVAETDAKIAELRQKRKEAFTQNADLDLTDELDNQIQELRDHKHVLGTEASIGEQRQRQAFETDVRTSQAKAVEMFPDCMDKESALTKAMIKIDKNWGARNHPDFYSPHKPLLLAQEAADLLGIAPGVTTPKAPAAASPQPVKTVRPVQPAAPIASGATRTTQAAPQNGQLVEKLNKISSPADYEAAVAEAGGKRW